MLVPYQELGGLGLRGVTRGLTNMEVASGYVYVSWQSRLARRPAFVTVKPFDEVSLMSLMVFFINQAVC